MKEKEKMKTATPIEITYTVMLTDEIIQNIKEENGTRYWVEEEDSTVGTDHNGDTTVTFDGTLLTFSTEVLIKGIKLWLENGGNWSQIAEGDTDHLDNDNIWQYGFFGELVFG